MGIRKIGIMELIMCTVNPSPISKPMTATTVAMATSMGATTNLTLRKKYHMSRNIIRAASGADRPICTNIW